MCKVGKGLFETINEVKPSVYKQRSPEELADLIEKIYEDCDKNEHEISIYTKSPRIVKEFDAAMKAAVEKMFSKSNNINEENDMSDFVKRFNSDWSEIVEVGVLNPADSIKELLVEDEDKWLNIR